MKHHSTATDRQTASRLSGIVDCSGSEGFRVPVSHIAMTSFLRRESTTKHISVTVYVRMYLYVCLSKVKTLAELALVAIIY